jgi:NAD(P)-dependent dehydrogenase (short-subunit alcohol dehydrogenase family)
MKRIVVTGGSEGIGLAIVEAFASHGASVLIVARSAAKIDAVRTRLAGDIHAVAADLSTAEGLRAAGDRISSLWGEIDVLVNNAGLARFEPFEISAEPTLDLHLNLNVRAPFLLTQALFGALKARKGCVIIVSSFFARRMLPARPSTAYSLSKGALESFTKALAFEAGPHGVRVNAVAPGAVRNALMAANFQAMPEAERARMQSMVETIYPLGRIGTPDEVAGVVRFLASEEARWITGAIVPVDGGLTTS